MNNEEISLNHPHDYFKFKRFAIIPDTCFILMPFKNKFKLVYETIAEALSDQMVCSRADDLQVGSPILERILSGISTAELVIADLTERNAKRFL